MASRYLLATSIREGRMSNFGLPPPRTSSPLWKKLEEQAASKAFPSADVIARAIVTAARMFNEDPIQIAIGRYHVSGRYIAYYALIDEFPEYPAGPMARMVGAKREMPFVKKAARGRREFIFVDEKKITAVREAVRIERARAA
jgi:hypothetical protein